MVIDLFYLLNELDLLEIRLNILNEKVDRFIIIEATETFSGLSRNTCFDINDLRWSKWKDKIVHYVVDDFPIDNDIYKMTIESPNTGNHEHYWIREFYIKESARKSLVKCDDNDIVFISDIDEIWNPNLTYNPKKMEVLKPKQLPYLYYLNQRTDEDWLGWTGTTCCRYEVIKNGIINHIRTDSMQPYINMENGGWHFNALGGKEIKKTAFQHPVYEDDGVWRNREINMRVDSSQLPDYLKTTWKKYQL